MIIQVPISIGELIDKISILEIKSLFTDDEYVHKELDQLKLIKSTITQYTLEYEIELKKINERLWKIEDKLRKFETEKKFDDEFVELARNVYILNDKRSEIKNKINQLTNSEYKEVKIFNKYP